MKSLFSTIKEKYNKKLITQNCLKMINLDNNSEKFALSLVNTLASYQWVVTHTQYILDLLPDQYTNIEKIDVNEMATKLEVIGIHLEEQQDVNSFIVGIEFLGFILRDINNPYLIRANNSLVVKQQTFKIS